MCQIKQFMPLFTRICSSQISHVGDRIALQGAMESVRGGHGDDCAGFLTILDNILSAGKLARGAEQAGWLAHSHPGCPLQGTGRDAKNDAVADFAKAPRSNTNATRRCRLPATILRKDTNRKCPAY